VNGRARLLGVGAVADGIARNPHKNDGGTLFEKNFLAPAHG